MNSGVLHFGLWLENGSNPAGRFKIWEVHENQWGGLSGFVGREPLQISVTENPCDRREKQRRVSQCQKLKQQLWTLDGRYLRKYEILLTWFRFSFNRGAIPDSINMPYSTAFTQQGALSQCPELVVLNGNVGKILVIVGNRGDSAVKVR